MTKLSPNFSLAEMIASDTARRIGDANQPTATEIAAMRLLCERVLEPIRAHFGKPVRVNSGYRSPRTNAAVGSSDTSQHRRGEAGDIEIDGVSNLALARWIAANLVFDQLILENYKEGEPNSGWVHVSYRRGRTRRSILTMTLRSHGASYAPGLPA